VFMTQLQVQAGAAQRQGAQLHNRYRRASGTPGTATSSTVGVGHLQIAQYQCHAGRQGNANIQGGTQGTIVTSIDIDHDIATVQVLLKPSQHDRTRVGCTCKTVGVVNDDVGSNIVTQSDSDTVLTGYAGQGCIVHGFHGKTGNRQ